MADDPQARLERERADADRAYNDALTAFDRALVRAQAQAPAPVAAETIVPDLPGGILGRLLAPVRAWLAPSFERQQAFNARVAAALDAAARREAERHAAD